MAAAAAGNCHRPVGSFNPAWCLRPQTSSEKGSATTRWWEDGAPPTPSTSCSIDMTSRGRRAQDRWGFNASAEPPSPRVSCMGQIKEGRAAGGGGPVVRTKFQRLRRIFSAGRSALGAVAAGSPRAKTETSCGVAPRISMAELDPPLPVVRRAAAGCGEAASLWKRRCGKAPVPVDLQLRPQKQTHTHWLLREENSKSTGKVS